MRNLNWVGVEMIKDYLGVEIGGGDGRNAGGSGWR